MHVQQLKTGLREAAEIIASHANNITQSQAFTSGFTRCRISLVGVFLFSLAPCIMASRSPGLVGG